MEVKLFVIQKSVLKCLYRSIIVYWWQKQESDCLYKLRMKKHINPEVIIETIKQHQLLSNIFYLTMTLLQPKVLKKAAEEILNLQILHFAKSKDTGDNTFVV